MISTKIGKREFSIITGLINNDSYKESIKKLMLVPSSEFVQLVPARLVAGSNHLFIALETALSAFENGTAFTRKPEFEFLVRLVGNKQLNNVLEITEFGKEELVLVAETTKNGKIEELKKELDFTEKKIELGKNKKELMKLFDVSEKELSALKDLENPLEEAIIEKSAFVALER